MKQQIRNRWTNAVQFTADITCAPDATIGVRIGLAVKWARKNDVDLSGAYLSRANLRRADLSGANLSRAYLSRANLSDVDLSRANLSDVDLRDVDLIGANLSGANLSGANLIGANLIGANLSGAYLIGANLSGANLRGANLRDVDLIGANLSGANLSRANLSDVDLSGAPVIHNIHQTVYAAASQPGALDMGDWHKCETTHCRAGWVVMLAGEEGKALENKIMTPAAASLIYLASDPDLGKFPDFYCNNDAALADMKERAEAEAAKVSA